MSALSDLFSFEGRARRSEWWLICIGVTLLGSVLISVVSMAVSGGDWSSLSRSAAKPVPIVIVNLAVGALVFWIQIAVGVRRSHDRGQSGGGLILYQAISFGWSVVPMAALTLGLALPTVPFGAAFVFAFAVIGLICAVYFLITLGFLDGDPTANAYGQSPKMMSSQNYAAPRLGD